MKKRNNNIMIVVNAVSNLLYFRHELILTLINKGYKIIIVSPFSKEIDKYKDLGCKIVIQNVNRHGKSVVQDMTLGLKYFQIIQKYRPLCVLTYTIKPNLYAGLAARMLKVPYLINITGLGIAFDNKNMVRDIIIHMYRRVLKHAQCVFFQNKNNRKTFIKLNIPFRHSVVIPGSGVNIDYYKEQPYPKEEDKIKVLYVSRIMKDKGIHELVSAARILYKKRKNIEFHILGACEDNYEEKIKEWSKEPNIKYHGVKNDIRPYLKMCNCLVHPSYHEGMSNVCLEVAASARPILASNIPGCMEIFDEGKTGFGFEPKNVNALVKAIEKFANLSYEEKKKMGERSRDRIKWKFNRKIVIDAYMDEIECVEALKNDKM